MSSVTKAVKTDTRWRVEADEITLGFFSFGKFLMYKDLDLRAWDADTRGGGFAILNSLMMDGFKESKSIYDDETHIDKVVLPTEMHHVMDADSTQILAMLDVNTGRNLVLEGPPGTGKSQTITNVIAECIGNGITLLGYSGGRGRIANTQKGGGAPYNRGSRVETYWHPYPSNN